VRTTISRAVRRSTESAKNPARNDSHVILKNLYGEGHDSPVVKHIISTTKAPGSEYGPFSQAVRAGDFIFVMGQAAFDPQTKDKVVGDEIKGQTRRTLENHKAILTAAGASFDDVVQVRIFITNASDWAGMNEVYREYFTKDLPVRTAVVVQLAAKGLLVEIDMVAYVGK
jgi:2-iminobutanoate/2-iminopropanoate deaminase